MEFLTSSQTLLAVFFYATCLNFFRY